MANSFFTDCPECKRTFDTSYSCSCGYKIQGSAVLKTREREIADAQKKADDALAELRNFTRR